MSLWTNDHGQYSKKHGESETSHTVSVYEKTLKNVHPLDPEMSTGILTDTLTFIKGTDPGT